MNFRQYTFERQNQRPIFIPFRNTAYYVNRIRNRNLQLKGNSKKPRFFKHALLEGRRWAYNVTREDQEEKSEIKPDAIIDFSDKSEEEIYEFLEDRYNWQNHIMYKSFYYRPIHLAARLGDIELVKDMLEEMTLHRNITYSAIGPSETLLESAIRSDNVHVVRYLIKHGANFHGNKVKDSFYFLLLVHAFRLKSNKVVRAFLNKNTDLRYTSLTYGSLIHCAIYNGDLDLIQRVLDLGADVNSSVVCTKYFRWFHGTLTPLQTAIALKRVNIVKLLIRDGANVDQWLPDLHDHRSTLQFALDRNASNDIIVALLDAGADVFCKYGDYFLPFNLRHRYPSFTNLVKKLAVKLDTAGFNVWATNKLERILKDKKLACFREMCYEEVEKMANTKIEMTSITYYELLTRHLYDLTRNYQYNVLKSAVLNANLENQFPLYAGIIQTRFRNIVKKNAHSSV